MNHTGEYCPYSSDGTHLGHSSVSGCVTCMLQLSQLRSDLARLSGSGKNLSTQRRHGIYSTITIDGFDDMPALRDTMKRFSDFNIPKSLEGLTVMDVGSNVGALSFEAARRGASVVGLEYRRDRVDLCDAIAKHTGLDAGFYRCDLQNMTEEDVPLDVWQIEYDIVMCCSVDEYIRDRQWFYQTLREHTKLTLYLESNVQRDQSMMETIAMLYQAGFANVKYLGNGHSGGIARRRKLFRATV